MKFIKIIFLLSALAAWAGPASAAYCYCKGINLDRYPRHAHKTGVYVYIGNHAIVGPWNFSAAGYAACETWIIQNPMTCR